jgi:uncharacterized protein
MIRIGNPSGSFHNTLSETKPLILNHMKIVLFGTGMIGSRLLSEALRRDHSVTVVTRDPKKFTPPAGKVTVVQGDVQDFASVTAVVKGHDVVLSAVGGTLEVVREAPYALLDGLRMAGVKRLVVVGGAGSLEVEPGMQLMNTPTFPEAWKGIAIAHAEALLTLKQNSELDWSYMSPAAFIAPGERTGKFRLGGDQLLKDHKGESHISAEDFAIAFLDEVDRPQHIRSRFTIGY